MTELEEKLKGMTTELNKAISNTERVKGLCVELLRSLDRHHELIKEVSGGQTCRDEHDNPCFPISDDGSLVFCTSTMWGGAKIWVRCGEKMSSLVVGSQVNFSEKLLSDAVLKITIFLTARLKEHNEKTEGFFAEMRRILRT